MCAVSARRANAAAEEYMKFCDEHEKLDMASDKLF